MAQPKLGRRAARRRAVELLREVEIPLAERRLDDYPHQYSGGMRQRVMIAIALASEPGRRDRRRADDCARRDDQAQVLDVLERLVTERTRAMILITHNLGSSPSSATRVQVMYAGRIVERASTAETFARPAHPYTRGAARSVPRPDRLQRGPLPSIQGMPPNLAALPPGCSFEPRCPLGHGREVCLANVRRPAAPLGSGVAECHFAEDARGERSGGLRSALPASERRLARRSRRTRRFAAPRRGGS